MNVPCKMVNSPTKPLSSGNPIEVVTKGRHDPCVGVRATPIAEAMLAIVLMDHFLRNRAQNADVHSGVPVLPGSVG